MLEYNVKDIILYDIADVFPNKKRYFVYDYYILEV